MRLRARHIHHLETLTDNIVGYAINIAATALLFNAWLGHNIPLEDNLLAGVGFFIVAYVRKYTLRRWFSAWIQRIYDKRSNSNA